MNAPRWVISFLLVAPLHYLVVKPWRWLVGLLPHRCESERLREVRYSKIGWHDGPCPHVTGDRYYLDSLGEPIRSQAYGDSGERLLSVLRPEGTLENSAISKVLEPLHVKSGNWRRLV